MFVPLFLIRLVAQGNLNEKEIEETVKLEHPRASAYDDKIGNTVVKLLLFLQMHGDYRLSNMNPIG